MSDANRLLTIATALGNRKPFLVQRFSGREEMSRMFEYQVELLSEHHDIDPKDLLGTNATVAVERPEQGKYRYFNGYITRFAVMGKVTTPAFGKANSEAYKYVATLSPWLWFLTRSSTCHVSVDETFQSVIDKVLGRYGDLKKMKFDLQGDTEKREHLVQYRETDFNYVSRLAEQAGLYYYFTHEDGNHELVFTDNVSKHKVTPKMEKLHYNPEKRDTASVNSFDYSAEVQSGSYTVEDFNLKTPRAQLRASQAMERTHKNAKFELYDYPAEFPDSAWGEKYAKMRIEESHCRYASYRGVTKDRGVQVGHKFTLADHVHTAVNGDYLVISHSFSAENDLGASGKGEGARFDAEFTAIPAATQFRAARITPKPAIPGPQTAFVVGPAGEEIYTDQYGRVRLQFHWDRLGGGTEKNQCWVRVSQLLAGKGWGWLNLPRVGQEVVVEFLEGDPDRPLVTGRVYNADQMPPYKLPDHKTRTGMITRSYKGGPDDFNELRLDDDKGNEQVFLQAQRNLDIRVKKDAAEFVGGKSSRIVKLDTFDKIEGAYHLDLKGDHSNKVGGSLSFDVTQDMHLKSSKALVKSSQEIHLKSDAKVVVEAGAQLSLKVGGNFVDINSAGVFIKGSLVCINSGGSAGSGSGASPIAAKAATEAITSAGGKKDEPPAARPAPKPYGAQAGSIKLAAATGAPLCAVCENC